MAITRQLIELMDGRISVTSTKGVGANFRVELPFPVASEQSHEERRGGAELDARVVAIRSRVLLVEDDFVNQRVACALLERLGCEVEVADDGARAIEKARDGEFDLIFMDCHMPRVDGLEATRRIIENGGRGARTPIVALTANAMSGDRRACLEAGMVDHVSKPVSGDDLQRVLLLYADPDKVEYRAD